MPTKKNQHFCKNLLKLKFICHCRRWVTSSQLTLTKPPLPPHLSAPGKLPLSPPKCQPLIFAYMTCYLPSPHGSIEPAPTSPVRFPDWLESHFPSGSGNLTTTSPPPRKSVWPSPKLLHWSMARQRRNPRFCANFCCCLKIQHLKKNIAFFEEWKYAFFAKLSLQLPLTE